MHATVRPRVCAASEVRAGVVACLRSTLKFATWSLVLACYSIAHAQTNQAALIEQVARDESAARTALFHLRKPFRGVPIVGVHQRSALGCSASWRRTSYWDVSDVTDVSPATYALVADRVFPLSGTPAPDLAGFVRALLSAGRDDDSPPLLACLSSTVAFALTASGDYYVDGITDNSVPEGRGAVSSLHQQLPADWPPEGLRTGLGDTVAVITVFKRVPLKTAYRPIGYAMVFGASGEIRAWDRRFGDLVIE